MTVTAVAERVVAAVRQFSPESRVVGCARTLLALAAITVLAITPSAYLFVPVVGQGQAPQCDGVKAVSVYCLAPASWSLQMTSLVVVVGLLVVASGYRPRWTAPLHWWLSFSIAVGISLPDGGEAVAQNVTFLMMFLCINDGRRWHWSQPSNSRAQLSMLNGISYVAHWMIRIQMGYVYLNSSLAKLAVKEWADGTALFYVLRGEYFGSAAPWSGPLLWVSGTALGALALAWGTIVMEGFIAVSFIGRPALQRWGWRFCVMLHVGIALFLGLWSFGMIMIGAVTVATFRSWRLPSPATPTAVGRLEGEDRGVAEGSATGHEGVAVGRAMPRPETPARPR